MSTYAQSIDFLLSQVRTSAGALTGGSVYAYAAGTDELKTIWLDRAKTIQAANPYTLDGNGTAALFGDGLYRLVIKTSAGVTVYDRDNIQVVDPASGVDDAIAAAVSVYVVGYTTGCDTLAAAVATIGSTRATLQFGADLTIAGNISIPSNIELLPVNGAKINHGAYTIEYLGSTARWPLSQIFNGTGAVTGLFSVRPEWFGATGDGTVSDQTPFQKAVAALGSGGGVVEMRPDATYRVTIILYYAGTHFRFNGATVKKIDNASAGDFERVFTNNTTGYRYTGATDSAPTIFEGGTIDGSRAAQGTYLGYELEHQSAIAASAESTSVGKMRVIIRNMNIKESAGDGINLTYKTDTSIENVSFWNCFRSGITVSGAGHIINGRVLNSGGDVHDYFTNIEPTAGLALPNIVNFTDCRIGKGLDISSNNTVGSRYTIRNVVMSGYGANFYGGTDITSKWTVEDCALGMATTSAFRGLYDATFTRCRFVAFKETTASFYKAVYVNNDGLAGTYRFRHCMFGVDATIEAADTVYGIYRSAELTTTAANVIVESAAFTGFDYALYMRGGTYRVQDITTDGPVAYCVGTLGTYDNVVYLKGFYDNAGRVFVTLSATTAPVTIHYQGVELSGGDGTAGAGSNVLNFSAFTNVLKTGRRTIYVAGTPTGGALAGDVAVLTAPTAGAAAAWVATTNHNTAATWKVAATLAP